MQLFILDHDPAQAARMLSDIHLRKMCLETSQILSALITNKGEELLPGMPKICNRNHPVIKALDNTAKINWVLSYNDERHREYFRRFHKHHAYSFLCRAYREKLFSVLAGEYADLWSFARAFKGITIRTKDIVEAYREYYRFKKSIIRNWKYTNAEEPEWLKPITAEGFPRCGQTVPE